MIARNFFSQETASNMDYHQEILEKLEKLKRETTELELMMECYSLVFKREFNKWKAEKEALPESDLPSQKPTNEQILFLNERYKEIFDLHEQGLSAEQIAKQLDKGYGEVTFILQLASQEKKGD
ncbi:hypothetical protein ABE288_25465 [Bacillus salipaludis]|uniref:DUF6115 domain-containing protein n=1 Tax=Bacillus salipaludis TaxID=2547811 RepID=UPI003D1F6F5E